MFVVSSFLGGVLFMNYASFLIFGVCSNLQLCSCVSSVALLDMHSKTLTLGLKVWRPLTRL